MHKLISIFAATALLGCASVADAGYLADVTVINRTTGARLETYRNGGRLYIEGRAGDRYSVEIRNRSGSRILGVLSVDGVNVVSGQTAATSQTGYVLDARERAEIAGWRKDLSEVASFYFTPLPDSYAARTGRPENVGVIGLAVYKEAVAEPVRGWIDAPASVAPEAVGRSAAKSAASSSSSAQEMSSDRQSSREEKLGTGHGERIQAPTQYTEFNRASNTPSEMVSIYYASRQNLIAKGIIPRQPAFPQAFPGGFVPDPS